MSPASPSLAALQAVAADTVVTVAARGALQIASDVALVVMGAFVLVLLLVLVVLVLQLRKLTGTVRALGQRAIDRADPLIERGKDVADNVVFMSDVVRSDVERLNRLVQSLTERLETASERMDVRIREFNALMEVVQEEAEDIFVGTASTVRGVKAGADTFGPRSAEPTEASPPPNGDATEPPAVPAPPDEPSRSVFLGGAGARPEDSRQAGAGEPE